MKEEITIEEKLLLKCSIPVAIEKTYKILMQKNISKLNTENGKRLVFCKIPFQNKYLTVLMTNNHIVNEN